MRIWTVTDVTDGFIRTSVHGSKEDALNGLRSFIEANTEYTEEELTELGVDQLEDIDVPETDFAMDEHDLPDEIIEEIIKAQR